ncbi:unnamed protein product [Allacma fusca]|uniref:M-phase inducer phosphatase n=1 Tax=Allacma fusca TaxID=39272 RepID=A0A8J2M424_9HEXA|nr:unnamed protein product [Allacma fusca]
MTDFNAIRLPTNHLLYPTTFRGCLSNESNISSTTGATMDWDSIFSNKKPLESGNGSCSSEGPAFSKQPLRDVNNSDRIRTTWSNSNSFKSPEKTLDHVDDSQDSGVSFSPSRFRVKKLAKRPSKMLSPAFSNSKPRSFESVEEDMDIGGEDGFEEAMVDFELPSVDAHVPKMMSSLLTGQIKHVPVDSENDSLEMNKENFHIRKAVSRKIFTFDDNSTPPSSKTYDLFKRPSVPEEFTSPAGHKRIKSVSHGELLCGKNRLKSSPDLDDSHSSDDDSSVMDVSWEASCPRPKQFLRSQSESAVSIIKSMELIDKDPMLIGDASKRFVLPIIEGKHKDLKEIGGETLVKVLNGEYKHVVDRFEVIDCRYPYEYEGGHIKGAINIHTQKQLHQKYLQSKSAVCSADPPVGRHIIVFHCEFSSHRAPDLCRFLREADRHCNSNSFPSLHYPELYVLYGGYKAFYESYKEFCEPQTYLEMNDPKYTEECKWHKSQSKSDFVPIKSNSGTAVSKIQRKPMKKFNGF